MARPFRSNQGAPSDAAQGAASDPGRGRPVIALLTDFGLRDHYVGTMKGVILGIAPDAAIVDITHDIPPQDVLAGAYELEASYRFFPPATVFVVVVDPGVGTSRRAIAFEAGGYHFVGPDNGVLALVASHHAPTGIVEIAEGAYGRTPVSRTFEGRDRFAPAGAWLAQGVAIAALGPPVPSLTPLAVPVPDRDDDGINGRVIGVDRFGNLITNIDRGWIEGDESHARVTVADSTIAGVIGTYGEAADGALCALVGSSGRLEIAVNGGSAAAVLGVGRGAPVRLRQSAPG
jgi:S-adenosylmethionine hydrolase